MKIAYLCADRGVPILGDKGASVHVREFVKALARFGHEVTLLCANRGLGNPPPPARIIEIPPGKRPAQVTERAARLGLADGELDIPMRRELARLVYDEELAASARHALESAGVRPDVLYERYALFGCAGGAIAEALGIPQILEVNAPLADEQERFRSLRLKTVARDLEKKILRRADHVIAVSDAIKDFVVLCGVPETKVTVVPNGVDVAKFHPQANGARMRVQLGLSGKQVIGFVGSLKIWHGLDFLLDGFARITQRFPDAVLLIVGEGPLMPDLRARIAREDLGRRVILTGRVDHAEVPEYLEAMDLTAAPYPALPDFYFSPLKVVESQAVGRPVVAPRLGQLTSLVRDGETGMLYDAGDLDQFVGAVTALLEDRPRLGALSERASAWARANFSWEHVARRTIEVMTNLLPRRRERQEASVP